MKHNEMNDQIYFREDNVGGRARVTTMKSEYCEDVEQSRGNVCMKVG